MAVDAPPLENAARALIIAPAVEQASLPVQP
jgi:hypothetical protein